MVQSLLQAKLHIVFSTKDRLPFIKPSIEKDLYAYIAGTCKQLGSIAFEIGGVEDHIHILASLSKTTAFSEFIGVIKSSSSKWMKSQGQEYNNFFWQKGFGAFAIEDSSFDNVRKYILNQKEHHKKRDFKQEYIMILKRYNVPYVEEYLWD
jgi:REP-associated tyrosine transposase